MIRRLLHSRSTTNRDRDLGSHFVQGGVAADTEEHVRMAEETCRTIPLAGLEKRLA